MLRAMNQLVEVHRLMQVGGLSGVTFSYILTQVLPYYS